MLKFLAWEFRYGLNVKKDLGWFGRGFNGVLDWRKFGVSNCLIVFTFFWLCEGIYYEVKS